MPMAEDVHQRIEQRAYELWQQRGSVDGDALSDWLRAEVEVLEQGLAVPQADKGGETAEPKRRTRKHTNAKREP